MTVRRRIIALALPAATSSIVEWVSNMIELALLGGLGASAVAAWGIGQLLATLATSLFTGLAIGLMTVVSQLWGAGHRDSAGTAAAEGLRLGLWAAAGVVGVSLFLAGPLTHLMGAEHQVADQAGAYLSLLFLFFPAGMALVLLTAVYSGIGDTATPMRVMVGVSAGRVLLLYPMIYGLGGWPGLGLAGAAMATGLSELVGAACLFEIGRAHV